MLPLLPPNIPLFRLSFFSFPSLPGSWVGVLGVPGRLPQPPGGELREGTSRCGGGSRGSKAGEPTGWTVSRFGGDWRRWGVGRGYSGAVRCVADCTVVVDAPEAIRFLTLLRRPLDSDEAAELLCCGSEFEEPPRENRLESRWLDFFLASPSMVSNYISKQRVKCARLCGVLQFAIEVQHVGYRARRNSGRESTQGCAAAADGCAEKEKWSD